MFLEQVFIFVIFLGPLVFFHELGHFFFARLAGVKVEVFSIGFGPKIFKWKGKETEYALSIIPLGGYVKMFGDDPLKAAELTEEEKKVAYTHKSIWRRFWIVFGGPLANFILAYFLYLGLVTIGEKVPQARFGHIEESHSFYSSGLRSGDILSKVNDQNIMSFDDLNLVDTTVTSVQVLRDGKSISLPLEMNGIEFIKTFSQLNNQLRMSIVSNSQGKLFYLKKKGESSKHFSLESLFSNGEVEVELFEVKGEVAQNMGPESLTLALSASSRLTLASTNDLLENGYYPLDLKVEKVVKDSPAQVNGIQEGDLLIEVGGNSVSSFEQLRSIIQENGVKSLEIVVLSGGVTKKISLSPQVNQVGDKKVYTVGIYSGIMMLPISEVEYAAESFSSALFVAARRTSQGFVKTLEGFKKLITGEVSLNNIGGPIAIGKVASDSFNVGLAMFFRLMAIISINLGIINLFPIPVLDGGHLVFLAFEALNGGPLSRKKLQIAQQFGLSILFFLIFVALYNDITRLFG